MNRSCVIQPRHGKRQFDALKKQFGYTKAVTIFTQATNERFLEDYKDTLVLDGQGVPTLESMLQNDYIKNFITNDDVADMESKKYSPMKDSLENYQTIMQQAFDFNQNSTFNDNYIALMQQNNDDTIQVVVKPKTDDRIERFNNEYSTLKLNQRLQDIFGSIGVTIGDLYKYEYEGGRLGVTDFNKAAGVAQDFSSIVRVANNVSGAKSISEEFSHLIVGVFHDDNMVQRSLNFLSQNEDVLQAILGNDYNDEVAFHNNDMMLVAEEALGRILQDELISYGKNNGDNLIDRTLNVIRNKFKGFDYQEVERALVEADAAMKQFAKNILEKNIEISQDDIRKAYRNQQFNSLDERAKRNLNILQKGINTEVKRFSITTNQDKKRVIEANVRQLQRFRDTQQTMIGLCQYIIGANDELKRLNDALDTQSKFPKSKVASDLKFRTLREVRQYVASYGQIINDINDALTEDEMERSNMSDDDLINDTEEWLKNDVIITDKDGVEYAVNIKTLIADLQQESTQLMSRFNKIGMPLFAEFLSPFMPDGFIDQNGDKLKIQDLLQVAEHDITWFDRWLDPMSDASNLVLQLIDAAVKEQKTQTRLQTIDAMRDIMALMQKFEDMGIKTYEWMFDTDRDGNKSGKYLDSVKWAEFQKDYDEEMKYLEDKYGTDLSGDIAKKRNQELKEWRKIHCQNEFSDKPNLDYYRNERYYNLQKSNPEQFKLYQEFLTIKGQLDDLHTSQIDKYDAIQIRKDGLQRIADSSKSLSELFDNVKQLENERWKDAEDDDQIFGATTKKALIDFDGREFLKLPALYVSKLKNPNELSDDVFSTLISYAYASYNFYNMNQIVDALEVGRNLIRDNMEVRETRGGKQLLQSIKILNDVSKQNVKKLESNLVQRLNDYYESQVYGRYLKDQGTIGNTRLNTNKVVSRILEWSSLAQLGFNFLANIANIETGKSMQRIEAVSGQFFNYKELVIADKEYAKLMGSFLAESGKRVKSNKLSLFDQLFDIKQNFDNKSQRSQRSNLLKRIFGEQIAFFGQDAGDHWLYNRTAIAMAMREQVIKDGKQMSLWDALEVTNDKNGIAMIDTKGITDVDGNEFSVSRFKNKVAKVNQGLFGVYNSEDSNAANRVALGRLLQQYRKWIKPQMNKRFMGKQYSVALGEEEEGYYRTLLRLLNECRKGQITLGQIFSKDGLSDMERFNVRRAMTEVIQFLAVLALVKLIDWPDDKDRPYFVKLAEYVAKRELHELGGLTPSPTFVQEQLKNVKTPVPSLSAVQNMINLGISLIDPSDWVDEMKSGPYKGMSTLHKNFLKAPIPGVAQYYQIRKFTDELDTSINYYARPW